MRFVIFRGSRQHYGRLNDYEPELYRDNEIQEEDDDDDIPGERDGTQNVTKH